MLLLVNYERGGGEGIFTVFNLGRGGGTRN